jgi:hypothetical protein
MWTAAILTVNPEFDYHLTIILALRDNKGMKAGTSISGMTGLSYKQSCPAGTTKYENQGDRLSKLNNRRRRKLFCPL